ncbi:J domain-containing protein [Haloarchaeobius sp. TZWWS8]|uniref:J domain-containing protein n=1 Tax=Haloarchaeobius sp. TZWWS8 TaxID=3446121 RepID=UPI003EB7D1AE
MFQLGLEWATALPAWLLAGLSLGVVFTVFSATMFVAGEYFFRTPTARERGFDPRLSGDARRREEIRWYLDAIGEQYAEGHPVAGHHVEFYLPKRDVAVTFDAHAFFRIQGTDTYPVLCEHEMHGYHLGSRLPFEVPEISWEVDDEVAEADVVREAFGALGIAPSATPDEVRAAYRNRVKEAHPDHGGDEATFRRIREAYTVAKEHAAS